MTYSFPGASKIRILQPNKAVKITVSRSKPIYSRSGRKSIQAGVSEVVVEFPTPTVDTNWNYGGMTIVNTSDGDVDRQYITVIGFTAPSQSGFTVKLSAETLSANYVLHWSIAELYNP